MEGHWRTAEKPPATFSLATAFFVLAVLCVLLAEYQAWGRQAIVAWWFTLLISALFLAIWKKRTELRNLALFALSISIFVPCCLNFGMLDRPHDAYPSTECMNQLKQLTLGVHTYADKHSILPRQNQRASDGKPGLSWRVTLLPFLEHDNLFKRFNLDQAWDHPMNRPLADTEVRPYRCPAETNQRNAETSYIAIMGNETCWPAGGPIKFSEIPDGSSNTLLLTETHDSAILWPEPRDLEYDKLDWRIHGTRGNSVSSSHGPAIVYFDGSRKLKQRTGVNVAMADGSVRRLPRDVDPEVLKQMANRRDGLPEPSMMPD